MLDRLVNRLVNAVTPIGVQFGMRREDGKYRIKIVNDIVVRDDFDEYALLQAINPVIRAHAAVTASIIDWGNEVVSSAAS